MDALRLKIRRLFRFRLLTLLLVMTLLAVWVGTISNQANRQRRAVAVFEKLGLDINYSYQKQTDGSYSQLLEPPGPKWLRRLIGQDYFQKVAWISTFDAEDKISAEGMTHLAELPYIELLHLNNSNISDPSLQYLRELSRMTNLVLAENDITDAGLSNLKDLRQLETLGLSGNRIEGEGLQFLGGMRHLKNLFLYENPLSDVALSHIANIPNLEMLGLSDTPITDRGTKYLANLSKLNYLSINCEDISDASIEHFAKMNSLRELELYNTKVTPQGIDRLRKALPKCRINGKGGDGKSSNSDPFG